MYRRIRRPGATVFLTINLVERGGDLLTRNIDLLRDVARRTLADKPFSIDAWVVLPDHMHCIWTLPEDDSDYPNRVGMLKARFSREIRRSGHAPTLAVGVVNVHGAVAGRARSGTEKRVGACPDLQKDEAPIWQKRFWEHHIRDEADLRAHLRYCWMNPVKHGLCEHPKDWPYSSYHRDGVGVDLML
jgi:putative transposase